MKKTIKWLWVEKWQTGIAALLSILCFYSSAVAAAPETAAPAADTSELSFPPHVKSVWINAGMFSRHFDRSLNYNENNHGVGVEVELSDQHAAYAGTFLNSVDEHSTMLGWVWRPWTLGPVRIGAVGGLIDGYPRANNGGWFVGVLPVASIESKYFGVNFLILPDISDKVDGAAVVQFKLRLK